MPRASRYYVPGHVWHITHRCHERDFLLKFGRDRQTWLDWLFEAKKRFGTIILDYMATSNHIHLLVYDAEGGETIPKSIQLSAGRTAQQFNRRKNRAGAFWEDRYHATAIQTGDHLARCIVYIDLNMVRAGVVKHPSEWACSGYAEIQKAPERYRLIDRKALMQLLGIGDKGQLSALHLKWVEDALKMKQKVRERTWSESLAVGGQHYVEGIKAELGARAYGRKIVPNQSGHELREFQIPYPGKFEPKMPQ